MLRILHIGIGPLGQRIQRDLLSRPSARTVAAVDLGPAIGGRLLNELVENCDPSLRIEKSLEAIRDWSSIDVAIVTTSSSLARCADVFRALLGRGLPVVSTCEELAFPWKAHAKLADELDRLAREKGGRLLGTGINPGFLMDTLPLFLTGVMQRVDSILVQRIQDATSRRIPFQRKIGASLSVAEFETRVADGSLRHVGLAESTQFLAHYLKFDIDDWHETIEPILAEHDLASGLGTIAKGKVAGVRQIAEGRSKGRSRVRLEFAAAVGMSAPVDRVHVEGEPSIELAIPGGVQGDIATSSIVLNALPRLVAAPAGLHTMATLPTVYCAHD